MQPELVLVGVAEQELASSMPPTECERRHSHLKLDTAVTCDGAYSFWFLENFLDGSLFFGIKKFMEILILLYWEIYLWDLLAISILIG